MSNALLNTSINNKITIEQKILEIGHTQMEADSVHSVVERALKNKDIYVPADYIGLCKGARKKPEPYDVTYLDHTFFKSFKNVSFFKTIRPGRGTASDIDEPRFKKITRVNWKTFDFILNLVKDDASFNQIRSCKQFPLKAQLAIVLYRLGSNGEGATLSKIAGLFGVSDGGIIQNLTDRIFKELLKHKDQYLFWPNSDERKKLVSETWGELPNCVGYVDGTEIPLAEKPSQDSEAYFSRKHQYSVKVQAVCDHSLQIRHLVLGYPGSVHDARIFSNCELSNDADVFLEGAEWIAGDSAYKLSSTVITPF
ncbi:uncharacterized protein LOC125777617 [Bactrocera dorsalis]|uniref:Uncharacterized protein LOC125777617 n=1 Tax=Bactrocera dorsalis TaxID=27457 RepID=A0ABM3JHG2_BACDO|nr:uncharacterized protein LOC125777617 [Bactrocera dorsalis]